MDTRLLWRRADSSDIGALQRFICTDPERATYDKWTRRPQHPRPWELKVQSLIRAERPPYPDDVMLLGEDDDGIGAVAKYGYYSFKDAPRNAVFIAAIAVHMRFRQPGQSSGLGLEAVRAILEAVEEDRPDIEEVLVQARVHRSNVASQRLCEGLELIRTGEEVAGLETWAGRLHVHALRA